MLKYPPEQRITAQEAYEHDWIKNKKFNVIQADTSKQILTNLRSFHVILKPLNL